MHCGRRSSVHDWYWASGDTERFLQLAPDVGRVVDNVVSKFLQPRLAVQFVGWDDRIANVRPIFPQHLFFFLLFFVLFVLFIVRVMW